MKNVTGKKNPHRKSIPGYRGDYSLSNFSKNIETDIIICNFFIYEEYNF